MLVLRLTAEVRQSRVLDLEIVGVLEDVGYGGKEQVCSVSVSYANTDWNQAYTKCRTQH
jgi:hypothetical protein